MKLLTLIAALSFAFVANAEDMPTPPPSNKPTVEQGMPPKVKRGHHKKGHKQHKEETEKAAPAEPKS